MKISREQILIDACFEFAIKAKSFNADIENERIAKWVRTNLRGLGFDVSDGVGSSWGVLKNETS